MLISNPVRKTTQHSSLSLNSKNLPLAKDEEKIKMKKEIKSDITVNKTTKQETDRKLNKRRRTIMLSCAFTINILLFLALVISVIVVLVPKNTCNSNQYYADKICVNYLANNDTCTMGMCNPNLYLSCKKDSTTNTDRCLCNDGLYWIGYACGTCNSYQYVDLSTSYCTPRETEGKTCSASIPCLPPMNCTSNTCQCASSTQYHDYATLTCNDKKLDSQSCSTQAMCRSDLGLSCQNFLCKCDASIQYWNGSACQNYKTYGDTCASNQECKTILVCNSAGQSCTCPNTLGTGQCDCPRTLNNEYYWNGVSCQSAVSNNQPCNSASTSYMCKTLTEGTVCSSNGTFKCQCASFQYFNIFTSKCEAQLLNGIACSQADSCRADLGLSCQSGNCKCDTTIQFWNGSICINYKTYSNACTSTSQCKTSLICNTAGQSCNCSLALGINYCDCLRTVNNENFWNGTACQSAQSYNQACTNTSTIYMCKTLTEGTICSNGGSGYKCQCPSLQYYNTFTLKCENQFLNSVSCPIPNSCRADLGLSCQSGFCKCNATIQYWNGSTCIDYSSYGEPCTTDSECESTLLCRNSTRATCLCPNSIALNRCDCPPRVNGSEYYWNSTQSKCVLANLYGEPCSYGANYTCQTIAQGTYCSSSSVCDCNNGALKGSYCVFCQSGWKELNGICYAVKASTYMDFSNMNASSATVKSLCGKSQAKLADLSDPGVYNLFRGLSSYTEYWIDALRIGGVYKSSTGNVYDLSGCSIPQTNPCMVIIGGGPYCFMDRPCYWVRYQFCEYTL